MLKKKYITASVQVGTIIIKVELLKIGSQWDEEKCHSYRGGRYTELISNRNWDIEKCTS